MKRRRGLGDTIKAHRARLASTLAHAEEEVRRAQFYAEHHPCNLSVPQYGYANELLGEARAEYVGTGPRFASGGRERLQRIDDQLRDVEKVLANRCRRPS